MKVEGIRTLSPTVKEFSLRWMDSSGFDFTPGQFVMLDLPIGGVFSARSYSLASAPQGDGAFKLCIVQKPGGAGTDYLFNEVKPGSILACSAAQGSFVLAEPLPTTLVFICTGTGVAPFRAMLQSLFKQDDFPNAEIHLIFGCRTKSDLLYYDEFKEWETKNRQFFYHPVLSREPEWNGYKGYVHQVYQQKFLGLSEVIFYLCGWSNMVREAKNNLKQLGYHRRQIKFELYD